MNWVLGAGAFIAILLFVYFRSSRRKAIARGFSAMHACQRRDWEFAEQLYREGHGAAGNLKDPTRSRLESQIEIQWANVLHRQGKMREAEELIRRGISKAKGASLPEFQIA